MTCSGCGRADATRISYSSKGESCNFCGNLGGFKFSDVYFKEPYFDPHLSDPVKSPFGTQITSRSHKASVMKQLGISEVGDKRHGSRF